MLSAHQHLYSGEVIQTTFHLQQRCRRPRTRILGPTSLYDRGNFCNNLLFAKWWNRTLKMHGRFILVRTLLAKGSELLPWAKILKRSRQTASRDVLSWSRGRCWFFLYFLSTSVCLCWSTAHHYDSRALQSSSILMTEQNVCVSELDQRSLVMEDAPICNTTLYNQQSWQLEWVRHLLNNQPISRQFQSKHSHIISII